MSPSVFRCVQCDHRVFPARFLCPKCHGDEFEAQTCTSGVVTELTRSALSSGEKPSVYMLATVASDAGPVLIARVLDESVQREDKVALALRDGGIYADPVRK
ncbi:zinc ribbon domain-containing protein [Alcaligenes faecalis]|uniref:zinc ribbon domain-containing protein n=1 Tax=Alcaligenes faecalis TaxID=511 RepID=UPI0012933571|nr:zinc ribbon domain-containing protein [Alcaligenes faecalis]